MIFNFNLIFKTIPLYKLYGFASLVCIFGISLFSTNILQFFFYIIYSLILLWVCLYDLRFKLVSPVIIFAGFIALLPFKYFNLLGALIGFGVSGLLYAITVIISKFSGKDYFGFGDVLVCLLIGGVSGPNDFIGIFFGAFYIQFVIVLIGFLLRKKFDKELPFVPMLGIAVILNCFINLTDLLKFFLLT